jgi:NADH:ubiquinone oxidoreductase subunit E
VKAVARVTAAAAIVIVLCAASLSVDYAVARRRAPRDTARIEALQQQVRMDASLAAKLEAEQKSITAARDARGARIRVFSIALMVAAAAFLAGAKYQVKPAAPPPCNRGAAGGSRHGGALPNRAREQAAGTAAPAVDLAVVDAIIAREGRSQEAAIPILQAIQAHFRYLPDEALRHVCETTEITPAQIAGTSSFYSRFRRSPVGEHIVRVCHGTACHVSGARQVTDELRRGLGIPDGADTDPSRTFTIEEVACLGCCSLAPVMMVDEKTAGKLRPADALDALWSAQPEKQA